MSYKVEITSVFARQAKRLSKKYSSLRNELANLCKKLTIQPFLGDALGNNAYKIRLGVESKGKGKRGGVRVITYCVTTKKIVYLLSIYDKSEIGSIEKTLLRTFIQKIGM
jgi:mRNA-degrading endonuclease RelE of RelBE toxin-antitoxin system